MLCTGGEEGGFLGGESGVRGWECGREGGHLLTIYKKGAYKNLQGDSSVFPKNPELRPPG